MRTWQLEMLVVACALSAVAAFTADPTTPYVEWIGALAVLLTFGHVQVADRLAETEARREELRREAMRLARLSTSDHEAVGGSLPGAQAAEAADLYQDHVDCHAWAGHYLASKEVCWLFYFVLLEAYSALVGVGIFLLYPLWRKFYRMW